MIEPELAFATLDDCKELAVEYLKYCAEYALLNNSEDIKLFERTL